MAQRNSDYSKVEKEVLWIYTANWKKNGMIESIMDIPDKYDKNKSMWIQDDNCSGTTISNKPCKLRIKEMELVSYTPKQCKTDLTRGCEGL